MVGLTIVLCVIQYTKLRSTYVIQSFYVFYKVLQMSYKVIVCYIKE
jgi:hypothetical protein